MSESRQPVNGHARLPLGRAPRGFRGRIEAVEVAETHGGLPATEIENRLLELGFVEGARVEILHEGAIGRDPIAVRLNNATIALRRREAMSILAVADAPASGAMNGSANGSANGPAKHA
jgi:ferrous iron transport protein A